LEIKRLSKKKVYDNGFFVLPFKGGSKMKKVFLTVLLTFLLVLVGFSNSKVTVWFAGTTKELMEVVEKQMIPEFEKNNPGITLSAEFIPWGELSTKLTTGFAGGIGPDIFMHGQAAIAGFAEKGMILSLDDYLSELEDVKDFASAIDSGLYKGKRYFVPIFGSGRLMAYRKDLFEEAGLDPEHSPDNWQELRNSARETTKRQGKNFQVAGINLPVSGIDLQQVWTSFLIGNGGKLFNDQFEPIFNSPEGVEALKFYTDLIHVDKVASEYGLNPVGNVLPIAAGRAAISFVNSENMAAIQKYSPEMSENIKLTIPPKKVTRAGFYSFAGFMVSKNTENIDNTIKALAFLTSKDSIVKINKSLGGIPPRQSATEADFVASDPVLKKFVEGVEYSFANPNIPYWVQARDILTKYLERAVRGVMDPEKALDQAAEEIRKLQ
jgi:multiple sugar transport system substrate-binding protein